MNPRLVPLFAALVALAVPATGSAQLRVTLGVGAWTLRGEARTATSFSAMTRFASSIGHTWPLRGGFGLRGELAYALRGADARTELNGVPVDATLNLTYIDLPVLLEWHPVPDGALAIYAGPSFLYRLDARIRFRAVSGGPEFTESDPTVRRTGFAAVLGAETEVPLGRERVFVGARLVAGLSNVRNEDPPLRHAGGVLYVGFEF